MIATDLIGAWGSFHGTRKATERERHRLRLVILVIAVAVLIYVVLSSRVEFSASPPKLKSDILREVDRRLKADPPPPCAALKTAATTSAIKQQCPAFQPWSDEAVLYYARMTRAAR